MKTIPMVGERVKRMDEVVVDDFGPETREILGGIAVDMSHEYPDTTPDDVARALFWRLGMRSDLPSEAGLPPMLYRAAQEVEEFLEDIDEREWDRFHGLPE